MLPRLSTGIPSNTYKGTASALIDAAPRTRISSSSPGAPLVERISTPESIPCNAEAIFGAGRFSIFEASTLDTEPVRLPLLAEPYPIATTSSN